MCLILHFAIFMLGNWNPKFHFFFFFFTLGFKWYCTIWPYVKNCLGAFCFYFLMFVCDLGVFFFLATLIGFESFDSNRNIGHVMITHMWYDDQTFVVEAISFYRVGILLLTILVSIANSKQTILLLHIIKTRLCNEWKMIF